MKSQITDIFGRRDTANVINDVNLNNGYDIMNFFAAHYHTKFISVEVKNPELDQGAFVLPPPPPPPIQNRYSKYPI